jgi:hypothetical protein
MTLPQFGHTAAGVHPSDILKGFTLSGSTNVQHTLAIARLIVEIRANTGGGCHTTGCH